MLVLAMVKVKVMKTLVPGLGGIDRMDTIEHEGKLWLVPYWRDIPGGKWTMPGRLIRMDSLPHDKFREDFVLTGPVPKELFDPQNQEPEAPGYEVVDRPQIRFE